THLHSFTSEYISILLSLCSLLFFRMLPPTPRSTLFPYTTLFRSDGVDDSGLDHTAPIDAVVLIEVLVFDRDGGVAQGRRQELLRSEEHTSELQSLAYLVCRLLLEKKKKTQHKIVSILAINVAHLN